MVWPLLETPEDQPSGISGSSTIHDTRLQSVLRVMRTQENIAIRNGYKSKAE